MKELAKAVSNVQNTIKSIVPEAENPYFKSKYATLGNIWDMLRHTKVLESNGLCIIQKCITENGLIGIETHIIHHPTGQTINDRLLLPIVKQDPQASGSAITYARRYSLCAMLGITIADEDDDGNIATNKQVPVNQEVKHTVASVISPIPPKPPINYNAKATIKYSDVSKHMQMDESANTKPLTEIEKRFEIEKMLCELFGKSELPKSIKSVTYFKDNKGVEHFKDSVSELKGKWLDAVYSKVVKLYIDKNTDKQTEDEGVPF